MADNADPIPSKGSGKFPRSQRKQSTSSATVQVPTKRKSKSQDPEDVKSNKVSKVEEVKGRNKSSSVQNKRKEEKSKLRKSSSSSDSCEGQPREGKGSSNTGVAQKTTRSRSDSSGAGLGSSRSLRIGSTSSQLPLEETKKGINKGTVLEEPIASRLRNLPSRAAASAQARLLFNFKSPKNKTPTKHIVSSTVTSASKRVKEEGKPSHKCPKADRSHGHSSRSTPSNSQEQSTAGSSSVPTEEEEKRSRYRLRSRTSVEEQADSSGAEKNQQSSKSHPKSLGSKKDILLNRVIPRSKGKIGVGDAGVNPAGQEPSGRGDTVATSNTTGSCASSRCGREGVPSNSTVKTGESGMNSSPGNNQAQSSSTRTDQPDGAASTPTASGSTGAAAAASAFSRGLAMLSGETDADDGDMGRLQALLESRGLPPHLFGTLAPRMQQLLHRGISASSGNVTKAQQLLQGLQATGDEGQQLQAAIEMCQLLVMGNEDTLAGFPVKQTVPALIQLLSMEHNFDMMNHACRALTYMMEALPRSSPVVAEAVPVFLEKLQVIQCMDVAEQSLTALEMLSRRHAKTILQARGVGACLTFLDFFSIVAQRAALSVTANCMQNIHLDEFVLVADSLHFMATRLTQQDKKSVESVCLGFSRLVESFSSDPKRLEEIASTDLLANLQQLLVVTPPVVSTPTFILVLRMLAQLCARCPRIAVKLLEQNIVGTLSSLLMGSSAASETNDELVQRNPQELLEIVNLIAELLPKLPQDGIFIVNAMMDNPQMSTQDAVQWQWKDDRGQWNAYSPFDSRVIEAAHQSGEDEISLSMQGRTYTIDFLGLQQINEDSGTARGVQRKVNPFFCLKPSDNSASGNPEEKATQLSDERSSYLAQHPDFSLPFLRPLFALLSEANSSSAGPAVRTSCLKTLLRIVHFLPSESLDKALKPQVSNSLASMLGSSDLKIVVGAFQLCCLFMEKLQDKFCVHFRREGVFHQISRISCSEVVGPSPMKTDISSILGNIPHHSASPKPLGNSSPSIGMGASTNNLNNVSQTIPFSSPLNSTTSLPTVMNVNVPIPPPHLPMHQSPMLPPSPYSLCIGGFFMHQPGAPITPPRSDNGSLMSGLNLASVLDASRASDPRDIINVQPGITTLTSVIHGSSGSPAMSIVPRALKPERSASGHKSSDSSCESPGSASKSHSTSEIHDKKAEDSHHSMHDPYKRKRSSKRPIPTSRRLRQEDPVGAAPNSGNSSSTSTAASGSSSAQAKRSGKSGFFASLHPSRWTSRGSGGNTSSSGASANNSERSHHSNSNLNVGTITFSSSRCHNSGSVISVSKEQVKSWLKEQSVIFTAKYCRASSEGSESYAKDGMSKLNDVISHLRKESKMMEGLRELRTVVVDSDISSFEINHSGLIPAILAFLTDENGYQSNRDLRLRAFMHVFANCPLDFLSGNDLKMNIFDDTKTNALSALVAKLNSCLSQLEQFQVKVHELPANSANSRAAPTSALRFFNTHQLKCSLQRHPSCNTLRQWKGGPVKIDSLALVQTIERYLIAKGFGRLRESRDSGDSEDDNSDDDIDDTLAAAVISQGNARHKLQFLIGDNVLPYTMTVYQAIRQFGLGGGDPSGEIDSDFDPSSALLGTSGIWAQTHTIYYRPVPDDGAAVFASGSKSKKSKASSTKNFSKSKKDPMWVEGLVPDPIPPYLSYLSDKLPEGVTISDPCLPVLTLLRVVHSACRFWRYLYWPVLSVEPLLPPSEFINTKLAAKAQRQLQDPVVIMAGNVPQWLQQIGVSCPFLFPFEIRQMLFYSITFDRDRALQRLLDSVPELSGSEREDRVTPRLDRRKRTISRDNILHHAEQLMTDFGSSRPLLEIQYENEVGTGLGPTLEFYTLVSQELQKKELDLWHCESSVEPAITEDVSSKLYVQTTVGLFPKPMGKSVKAGNVSKAKTKFKFMGKFMAKAVMDSRIIDLPLSKALYKWILNGETSMCLADMAEVDSTVAQSIRKLVTVACEKKKLEGKVSALELPAALESLTLDGCQIDNLGLDFTLPGHPSIELKKGGKDIPVTIHNLEEYIKLVCHWMMYGGISRQMESWKEGFDSVFSSSSLKMFYPEELEMVFCGAMQAGSDNWDNKTLLDCCKADHGYTLESRAIQFLFQIVSSYSAQERRKFIQFVTGSPRLPVGGFKALQPQLTIVRKTIDGSADSDLYLPSVMTCVNYLKLPDYSTIEIMRERLRVAMDEGRLSFHLS